jgi:hypothetical protein
MDDSFGLGEPTRRPEKLLPVGRQRAGSGGARAPGVVAALAIVAALALGGYVVVRVVASGGEQAADAARTAVGQIAAAHDLAAQETARRATVAAMAALAQGAAFPSAEVLAAQDPSLAATTGASTSPSVASVAASEDAFAVAVASDSGACWWSRVDLRGVVTYGSGRPCTGEAAMAAAASSW